MQIIDFIDLNVKKIIDFGSGSGFPSIVLAILMKSQSKQMKITKTSFSRCRKSKYIDQVCKINCFN